MMFDIFFAQPLNGLARYERAIAFLSLLERLPLRSLARYLKQCNHLPGNLPYCLECTPKLESLCPLPFVFHAGEFRES